MKAFERFHDIANKETDVAKQEAWLEDYKGLFYSKGKFGKDLMKWKTERKYYTNFEAEINKIQRKKDRLVIEFDDKLPNSEEKDKEKIAQHIQAVKEELKKNGIGFIETTHFGASNYIWIEFIKELTSKEAIAFLKWIAPEDSEIDLNFARDTFALPVMFAVHWKHSNNRELPVDIFEGDKIDYDNLGIKKTKGKQKIGKQDYQTFQKPNTPIPDNLLQILKNPNLFKDITETEFNKKIVEEKETRKVIFLCAQGRLIENCQIASYNLLVNDDAGIGKDYVTGCVLEILPKEFYIHKTRISPAVFTYWHNPEYEPNWTWNGKVFYPEDISENVLNSDVFKVMTSKGSSATIVIRQRAIEIDINGKPVMITTTATATPNAELTRRFVILNLDSSEKQTQEIMKRHSEYKKQGLVPEYNPDYTEAMRYLKRVKVKIPYADLIDRYFPSNNIIMRTHYPRFLDFISASAGFHQFQRETDNEGFILATGQDYNIAKDCFLKLCSNKYMIPLTINQKKILEVMEEEPSYFGSVATWHSNKMSFISDRALQDNLQILAKYGILETKTGIDRWNRDIETYGLAKSYIPNKKIDIPSYEEICRNASIPSEPSLSSKASIPSEPKIKVIGSEGMEGIEPRKCNKNSVSYVSGGKEIIENE